MTTPAGGRAQFSDIGYNSLLAKDPFGFTTSPTRSQSVTSSNAGTNIAVRTTFSTPIGFGLTNNKYATFSNGDTSNNTITILRSGWYYVVWQQSFTASAAGRAFVRLNTTSTTFFQGNVAALQIIPISTAGQFTCICDGSGYYRSGDQITLGFNAISASNLAAITLSLDANQTSMLKVTNRAQIL